MLTPEDMKYKYPIGQFIYGIHEDSTIFEVRDFFIGVIIKHDPIVCIAVHSDYLSDRASVFYNPDSKKSKAKEFQYDIKKSISTSDFSILELNYPNITYSLDVYSGLNDVFKPFTTRIPTILSYEEAIQDIHQHSGESREQTKNKYLLFEEFRQRFIPYILQHIPTSSIF